MKYKDIAKAISDPENQPHQWTQYDLAQFFIQAEDEIERLREEVAKWKIMDASAATHVESVICTRSAHFTGEEPYVGWKGLGLALKQDYDEIDRLREALRNIYQVIDFDCMGDAVSLEAQLSDILKLTRAALKGDEK